MDNERVVVQDEQTFVPGMEAWQRELFEKILRVLVIVALPLVVVGVYYTYVTHSFWLIPLALLAYAVVLVGAFMPKVPYPWRVWAFLGILLVFGVGDLVTYGWGEDGRIYLFGTTLFAAIFLSRRHGLVALVGSCSILTLFVIAVTTGLFTPLSYEQAAYTLPALLSGLITFVAFSVALFASFDYLFPRLFVALQKSTALSDDLEREQMALAERTHMLQDANLNLQRRAMYLEATMQVSQILATVFELDALLQQAANLITNYFDFYHTGIFLMDEVGEWALLRAASSTGGRRMLARGHRLRRGSDSMVGWVVEHQRPRIAADVGEDAVYFANPDLPATHSAMTLPLLAGGQLIGILDVQSTEEAAFDQDDIRTLEGLAGLLAIAITNAQRLGDEASVLESASPLYRLAHRLATTRTEREIYTVMLESLQPFEPTRVFIFRVEDDVALAHIVAEMRSGEVNFYEQRVLAADFQSIGDLVAVSAHMKAPLLIGDLTASYQSGLVEADTALMRLTEELSVLSVAVIPIRSESVIRPGSRVLAESRFLGTLLVTYNAPHPFTSLQGQLYRVLSDLAGVALERTVLVQQAQARLDRERWIREFGEQVMRIPDLEAIMAQSVQLLQDAVQADGVMVSLGSPGAESETSPAR